MTIQEYFSFIVEEIHSTVIATVDDNGLPVTCAIDIMDFDENGLYFLTAKGKGFYSRLKKQNFIALTGMRGEDTLSCAAVSVRGKIREVGATRLPTLFQKNPYMNEIYPTVESIVPLRYFSSTKEVGNGLTYQKNRLNGLVLHFGGGKDNQEHYFVTDKCIGCKLCYSRPQKCIDIEKSLLCDSKGTLLTLWELFLKSALYMQ